MQFGPYTDQQERVTVSRAENGWTVCTVRSEEVERPDAAVLRLAMENMQNVIAEGRDSVMDSIDGVKAQGMQKIPKTRSLVVRHHVFTTTKGLLDFLKSFLDGVAPDPLRLSNLIDWRESKQRPTSAGVSIDGFLSEEEQDGDDEED